MAGLGETLQENMRLRELLAAVAAERDAAHSERLKVAAERDAARAEHLQLAAERELLAAKLEVLTRRTQHLEALLAQNDRKARGPASERFLGQLGLYDTLEVKVPNVLLPEPADPAEASGAAPPTAPTAKAQRRGTPKRRDLSADNSLPHRTVAATMPEGATCAGCGGALRVLGTTLTHRVEWVPGHF